MMLQLVCTVCISVSCVDVSTQNLESNHCTYGRQSSELQWINLYSKGEKWRKKYIRSNVMIMQQNYKTLCWSSVKDARVKK